MAKLKTILFLYFSFIVLIITATRAEDITLTIQKNDFTLREKASYQNDDHDDDFYLKLLATLPAGTKLIYDDSSELSKVLYNDDDNEIKRSRGSFYNVMIEEIPGRQVPESYKSKKLYVSKTIIDYREIDRSNFVNSRTLKDVDIRRRIFDSSSLPKESKYDFYLAKKMTIPKGSKISFDPTKTLEFPLYKNDQGKIKKSSGRYIGPLYFHSIPGKSSSEIEQLNELKLYTYEKGISLDEMNKKLFSVPDLYDDMTFHDKVLWDDLPHTRNWSKMAKRLVYDNADQLLGNPPSDIADFCPKYGEINDYWRAEFWVHLIAAIASHESEFQPGRINDESAFGSGNDVISRGLMQISFRSVRNNRVIENGCEISDQYDLHQPKENILCGLSLFKTLIDSGKNCISCKYQSGQKEGRFAGIARYWSTLRPEYEVDCKVCSSGKVTIGRKSSIANMTKRLSICR